MFTSYQAFLSCHLELHRAGWGRVGREGGLLSWKFEESQTEIKKKINIATLKTLFPEKGHHF